MDEDDVPAGEGNLVDASTDQEGSRARAADKAALERIKAAPPPVSGATPPTPAAPASPDITLRTTTPGDSEKRIKLVSDVPSDTSGAPSPTPAPAAEPTAEERVKALEAENAALKAKAPATPVAPAVEAEVEIPIEELNKQIKGEVAKDVECRNLERDWTSNNKRAGEIVTFNDAGYPSGGELVEVVAKITRLEGLLDPNKHGIEGAQEVDEITKDNYQRQLDRELGKRERLLSEHVRLIATNKDIDRDYKHRAGLIADHVTRTTRASSQAKARETQETQEVAAGESEWNDAFKGVVPTDLSKEDRQWVYETLLDKANSAFDRGTEIPNFERWMKAEAPLLLEKIGRKAGADAAQVAREKERTTRHAPTGPASIAAVSASPDNQNLSASERRRAADKRTALLSRRIVAR